jgi:hypothetical protein
MKRTLFKTRPLSPAERKRQENAAIVLAAAFRGKNAAQGIYEDQRAAINGCGADENVLPKISIRKRNFPLGA